MLEYVRQFDRSGDGLLSLPEFSKLVRLQPYAHCPMPNARCPMPNARCPMPNAQRPVPNAHHPEQVKTLSTGLDLMPNAHRTP